MPEFILEVSAALVCRGSLERGHDLPCLVRDPVLHLSDPATHALSSRQNVLLLFSDLATGDYLDIRLTWFGTYAHLPCSFMPLIYDPLCLI